MSQSWARFRRLIRSASTVRETSGWWRFARVRYAASITSALAMRETSSSVYRSKLGMDSRVTVRKCDTAVGGSDQRMVARHRTRDDIALVTPGARRVAALVLAELAAHLPPPGDARRQHSNGSGP